MCWGVCASVCACVSQRERESERERERQRERLGSSFVPKRGWGTREKAKRSLLPRSHSSCEAELKKVLEKVHTVNILSSAPCRMLLRPALQRT
jgi:hypothetical protein